jgi:hypothetical protein
MTQQTTKSIFTEILRRERKSDHLTDSKCCQEHAKDCCDLQCVSGTPTTDDIPACSIGLVNHVCFEWCIAMRKFYLTRAPSGATTPSKEP